MKTISAASLCYNEEGNSEDLCTRFTSTERRRLAMEGA